jgi:hypothetical protein
MRPFMMLILLSASAAAQAGQPRMVALANPIDSAHAAGLWAALNESGIEVVRADSASFEIVRDAPYVLLLGGQNSPGGVGAVVGGLLTENEKESLLVPGAKLASVREGAYASGQKAYIFAGYSAEDTAKAWESGVGQLLAEVAGGRLPLEVSAPSSVAFQPRSNFLTLSIPFNVTNMGLVRLTGLRLETYLNGGIRLEADPKSFDLEAGESRRLLVGLDPRKVENGSVVSASVGGASANVRLDVGEYDRVDRPCNVCAAGYL